MRRILLTATAVAVLVAACTSAPSTGLDSLPEQTSIIALGDSYTSGTSIDFRGSWPAQLEEALGAEGRTVDLAVIADDGWNTKRLHRDIERFWDGRTHDLIVLGIGVNDLILNFGVDNFREGLDLLAGDIETMRTATSQVMVLSLPDFRVTPWGLERIDRDYDFDGFNAILRTFASDIEAAWVDVTSTSSAALGEPTLVAPDDLHFSADMYALWADAMVETLSRPRLAAGKATPRVADQSSTAPDSAEPTSLAYFARTPRV